MVEASVGSAVVLHTTGDDDTRDDMEVDVDKELDEYDRGVGVATTQTGRAVFKPRGEASLRKS